MWFKNWLWSCFIVIMKNTFNISGLLVPNDYRSEESCDMSCRPLNRKLTFHSPIWLDFVALLFCQVANLNTCERRCSREGTAPWRAFNVTHAGNVTYTVQKERRGLQLPGCFSLRNIQSQSSTFCCLRSSRSQRCSVQDSEGCFWSIRARRSHTERPGTWSYPPSVTSTPHGLGIPRSLSTVHQTCNGTTTWRT